MRAVFCLRSHMAYWLCKLPLWMLRLVAGTDSISVEGTGLGWVSLLRI